MVKEIPISLIIPALMIYLELSLLGNYYLNQFRTKSILFNLLLMISLMYLINMEIDQ
jgi:hypothetical protein